MDVALELARARARAALELRARMGGGRGRKPKKQKGLARPAKVGPGAGCGTGKGGFQSGNVCALEDGIPDKPKTFAKGGALKKSNPKADREKAAKLKAKAAAKTAAKQSADKKKSIEAKRKKAAIRKKQKAEKESSDKKASDEAAAKKKQEMLQKIRVKKANEQVKIVKPADKYRGDVDQSVTKSDGETQFSFARRRVDEDLKTLHKEMDAAEKRVENKRQEVFARIKRLEGEYKKAANDASIAQDRYLKSKTQDNKKQLEVAAVAVDDAKQRLSSAYRERNSIDSDLAVEHHDIVSEFVRSHGNGLSQFNSEDQFLDAAFLEKTKSKFAPAFKENAKAAWAFLSKVAAPVHQAKGRAVKVKLDTKGGDAEYIDGTEVARHGVRGNGAHNTSAGTIIHEIAHGLHYGAKPETSPLPVPSSLKLPSDQQARDWLESPGYRARLAIKEDYDARVAALMSRSPQGVEQIAYHKDRQHYRMWKPKGEQRQRESYLGYSSQYADAENGNPTGATEVISMGVETLHRDPRAFRRDYRSHFDLTVLFLAGRLH
jgi:hypothetical protein